MAKFIFTTMQQGLTVFTSPVTSINYTITKNNPFIVDNKDDIEFFDNNKRFNKVSIFAKPKPDKTDYEEEFRQELLSLEGISEITVENMVGIYRSRKDLVMLLEENLPLDAIIPKEEQIIIKEHFLVLEEPKVVVKTKKKKSKNKGDN